MYITLSGMWLKPRFLHVNKSLLMKLFKQLSVDCYPQSDFCSKFENLLKKRKLEDIQEHISSSIYKLLNQAFVLQHK